MTGTMCLCSKCCHTADTPRKLCDEKHIPLISNLKHASRDILIITEILFVTERVAHGAKQTSELESNSAAHTSS